MLLIHHTEIDVRLNYAISFDLKNDNPHDGASQPLL